ncbi:hypothetical protein I4U23_015176 [Adineta vaga]|nr:hypothetical protein I4U23_015176 [Adineta vaga]
MYLLLFIIIVTTDRSFSEFSPLASDYDAYGLKITGNNDMLVEVLTDSQIFLIRYAPFNSSSDTRQCAIMYDDPIQYVYSVDIGEKQNSNQKYFFYAGKIDSKNILTTVTSEHSNIFIGILNLKNFEDPSELINCSAYEYQSLQVISSYEYQEFFVFSVEPYGQYAIGLAKDFIFSYHPFSKNMITIRNSSLVWPNDTIFVPTASDTSTSYTIVSGFVMNGPLFRVRATPAVYVISNSNLTILSTWSFTAVINSWQSLLTYSNLKKWSNKYVMSVNINSDDPSQVLVGMPFLNIVFLLIVSSNGNSLTLHSFVDNGNSVGFGKSVAWLSNSEVAILHSNYITDVSSKIYLYKPFDNKILPSLPTVIFPNIYQPLPITINTRFIRMISTPKSIVILAINSEILLISPAPPGYYASTGLITTDSILFTSTPIKCPAGTYKKDTSVFPCTPCSNGFYNPGDIPANSCLTCASDRFCPLGAVIDIPRSVLIPQSSAYVYPRSSEVTAFDEVLLQKMFSTGTSDHCLVNSPLFWVLLVVGFVVVIVLFMMILKQYVKHPRSEQIRNHVKVIFRQTDLISEGEMWIGGLVSFAIAVLLIFAYTFSAAFYREYPSDNSAPPTFSCDEVVRNVKYESGLQSLTIPIAPEEQPIFDLLNKQHFTLHLDLLNTAASCENLAVQQTLGSATTNLMFECTNSSGILSAMIKLTHQKEIITWILNDIALIGGVRIRLYGREEKHELYNLRELNFSGTLHDCSNGTLAQTATVTLELTKAVNETEPLRGRISKFSGIWYPSLIANDNQMFVTAEEYALSTNLTSTKLTVVIKEASYYIKNRQSPIAKVREIIFDNLLFTMVCLELFRFSTLLFKLTLIPLLRIIIKHIQRKKNILLANIQRINYVKTTDTHDATTDTDDYSEITAINHDVIEVDL